MELQDQLNRDLKDALKSSDKLRTVTLRGLKSAIKYAQIEAKGQLDEADVLNVMAKQAKQRRDSIADFEKAGRKDLVAQETAELAIIELYLPTQMSEDEIREKTQAVIDELGITDMKGMGQVMKMVMAQLKGQADGKVVNKIVRDILSN